jgi:hypothetical protein
MDDPLKDLYARALMKIRATADSEAPCEELEDAQRDLRTIFDIASKALGAGTKIEAFTDSLDGWIGESDKRTGDGRLPEPHTPLADAPLDVETK